MDERREILLLLKVACCDDPRGKRLIRSEKCECHGHCRRSKRPSGVSDESSYESGSGSTSSSQALSISQDPNWTLVEQFERQVIEETHHFPDGRDDLKFVTEWERLIQLGGLKDSLDLSSNESKRRLTSFFESLPTCQDCGEKHPPIYDKSFVDTLHSLKKKISQGITANGPSPPSIGCQWPNPCKADCLEEHGRARRERSKIDC